MPPTAPVPGQVPSGGQAPPPGSSYGSYGWTPGPQPPPGSPRPGGARIALVVAAVVVVVAAVVGGLVVLSGDDGDDVASDRDRSTTTESDGVEPPPLDEQAPDDEAPPAEDDPSAAPADEELVSVTDEEGGYSLDVPRAWGFAPVHGDTAGIGAEAFPDDPGLAAQFEQVAGQLPEIIVFFGVDPAQASGGGFGTNVNIGAQPSPELSQEELAEAARQAVGMFDGEVVDESDVDSDVGPGARIEYELSDGGMTAYGIQYYLYGDGTVWILTFTTLDMAANEALFDQIAMSFALL